MDTFMDPEQFPYKGKKVICIEGGETFLVYDLLQKTADYAKTFPNPPHIYIHTNGTLVQPDMVKRLRERDVEIVFSVDGNQDGSYLTMISIDGLRFGIINIVGNFGTVFVDQS